MTTSLSWDFSVTASDIITAMMENLGKLSAGGTVATADSTTALRRLNFIAKQYQGRADMSPGLKIHTRQRVTLFLAKGQQKYLVGPNSTDSRATTSYGRTTLSANASASATVLTIASNTDTTTDPGTTVTMTNADIIGIELNDGTIHWTTISGTPGATATVASGLASAAASGNYVWWFTARAQRFPVIESAALRDENRNDMPLGIYKEVAQYELGVVDKYADGQPTVILVEPLRLATRITLDSQPTDVTSQIVMTVLYPSEDYDATSNDIAFPQEAFRFLAWELSFECAPLFGVTWTQERKDNRNEARSSYLQLNPENSVLYFQCNA